ncbi:MAG TPA: ABC transporter permease [Phycisphaerae bacterium]|nr:ABC transporter permease [Phycisphaerae bacterium]
MNFVALKMLIGDRAKYLGLVTGLAFASLLITQQAAIFIGIMIRTCNTITDMSYPDIWVMDPKVRFIEDFKPLQDTQLYRIRSVEGVDWAVPLYKGLIKARLANGAFETCIVLGLDDATLIGGPPGMIEGSLEDLRRSDAVFVDSFGAASKLAHPPAYPGGPRSPLRAGDTLELNDHRAVVTGICRVSRTFQDQPVIFTTYSRATLFAPIERKLLTFVLAKAGPGQDKQELCDRIQRVTGLAAYTREQFCDMTVDYFLKYTAIPLNFGIAVTLGFIVGTAIAGQIFYNFTLDNLRHFAALKAMGATNRQLLGMILLQALFVGGIGYGIGVGMAAAIGHALKDTNLSFRLPWQLMLISAGVIGLIIVISAVFSMRRVLRLEPAIVFKN